MTRREELVPFLRRLLVTIGVLLIVAVALLLRDVWILAFAAALVAVAFRSLSSEIGRWTRLNSKWSLTLAVLVVIVVVGGAAVLAWPQIATQMPNLFDRIAEALREIESTFNIQIPDNMEELTSTLGGMADQLWSGLVTVLSALVTIVSSLLLVIVGGIFIAAEPRRYRDGLVLLFPKYWHDKVRNGMDRIGEGLTLWLRAQLVAMVVVGVLTGIGAWAIGLPSPLALGLIAGLGEFVPILGPFVATVPALIIAFAEDTQLLVWTIVVYIAVQQFEANLLTPLLQRQIVAIPPVLLLFSLVALGLLFGIPGIVVAAPLTVAIYVGVREFYVRDLLKEDHLLEEPAEPPKEEPLIGDKPADKPKPAPRKRRSARREAPG
ncbi:MAG: AI-2E family transporter [Bauldia sp.]